VCSTGRVNQSAAARRPASVAPISDPGRALAGRLVSGDLHQPEQFEPLQGAVDDRLGHPPDPAHVALAAQDPGDREPVPGLLADQAEHQPLGQ
jgi:hypothetical protein